MSRVQAGNASFDVTLFGFTPRRAFQGNLVRKAQLGIHSLTPSCLYSEVARIPNGRQPVCNLCSITASPSLLELLFLKQGASDGGSSGKNLLVEATSDPPRRRAAAAGSLDLHLYHLSHTCYDNKLLDRNPLDPYYSY